MAINLVIAVTDGDWFDMLRQQPNLAEVNFWAPSAANFRALQPGELFLFKANSVKFELLGERQLVDNAAGPGASDKIPLLKYPCWSAPIVSHGLLYVRGDDRLVCLELIPK